MKATRWVAVAVVALLALAFVYRAEVVLFLARQAFDAARDIGPYQEVAWERGPDVAEAPPAERPPNIVLILADDMGWNDVSTYGGGAGGGSVTIPEIDRLAREGVLYTHAFATTGVCAPSRHALITGMYPTATYAQHMRNGARTGALQ